jgi:hypothetical protein
MRKLSILALSGAVATIAISLPVTHAQSERPAPVVSTAVGFKILPSLREAAGRESGQVVDPDTVDSVFSVPNKEIPRRADPEFDDVPVTDPIVSSVPSIQAAPGPIFSVDGISNADNAAAFGFRISPPDTNGDVGPNHFVQTANLLVRVCPSRRRSR